MDRTGNRRRHRELSDGQPSAGPVEGSPSLPPLRGRAEEIEVIRSLVTGAVRGEGGVLVLEGPPGIGKSRLMAELLSMARQLGSRTAVGEAFEDQQSVPFAPLLMATVHAAPPIGDVEQLRRVAPSADLRFWVTDHLRCAIQQAAAETPLVIALEDVHWADNATLAALRSLTRFEHPSRLLWAFTVRTDAGAAVWDALNALRDSGATMVRLKPLNPDAVADVVQDAIRARADESLLAMADRAQGNPFLLQELVLGLDEDDRLTSDAGTVLVSGDELPARLALYMQRRLTRMSREARTVIQIASALPDRFSAQLLTSMLQQPASALVEAVDETIRGDLLVEADNHLRFRHDLLREATRRSLPQSLLRALERQSAANQLDMGAAPEQVASQLVRSAQPGDLIAIETLRAAAVSVARGDPAGAAELSKHALELTPVQDAARGLIVAETVVFLNQARRFAEARDLAKSTLATNMSAEDEAGIRLRVGSGTESPQDRVKENEQALRLADISDVTRIRHQAWLAYHQTINWVHGRNTATVADAAAAASASGDLEAVTVCETTSAIVDFTEGLVRRAAERIDALHERAHGTQVTLAHVVAAIHRPAMLIYAGHLEKATETTEAQAANARQRRDGMAIPSWAACEGMAYLTAGRLSDARAAIEALAPAEWGTATEVNMNRMLCLAEIAAHRSDATLLQHLVSQAQHPFTEGSALVRRGAAYVLALAAWHRDDIGEAARLLGGDTAVLVTPLFANLFHQLILSARVATAVSDDAMRAHVEGCLGVLAREHPPSPAVGAVTDQVIGILECDEARLSKAASMFQSLGWPLLSAGALEQAGDALVKIGQPQRALEPLNCAFDVFTAHEATADVRRVAGALRALGVARRMKSRSRPASGWDSLTQAEIRVVHLIAAGRTNAQVAAELSVSANTVKTHLRNAFGKLGITSRFELRQLLRPSDRTPT